MIIKINDRIRTRRLTLFNDFHVNLKYDAMASTFTFRFFFDPNNIEHKEMACIGHYHLCTVEHNGQRLITGQILSTTFNDSPKAELASIGGYSITGILEDCEIPTTIYPLQSDLLGLAGIAQKILAPFGLSMIIDPIVAADMQAFFKESECRASQSCKSYLSELAAQKNILISHNQFGQLVFTRAAAVPKPIFHFDGSMPATSMSLTFNGQGMHSHITVVAQADIDDINSAESPPLRNPYVINSVFRPKVMVQSSRSVVDDTEQAAKNALAQEMKNLKLKINMSQWELNGLIVMPGQDITVQNPRVYLYKKSNWIIEEVELSGNPEKQVASLTCVPREAYTGTTPEYMFKGINLH